MREDVVEAEERTGLTAGTLVEAVDGPVAIRDLIGKGMPVLTRLPSDARGFRILSKITPSAGPVPLVRIALENGHTIVVAVGQVIYRMGDVALRADAMRPGDRLLPSFHYPRGYWPRGTAPREGTGDGEPGLRVVAIEAAGADVVYRGRVNETGCMFLSAGVLCKA